MMKTHDNPVAMRLEHGRVAVTLTSQATGTHMTLRLKAKGAKNKRYVSLSDASVIFITVGKKGLEGNYIGHVKLNTTPPTFVPKYGSDPARIWAARELLSYIWTGKINSKLDIKIQSECARCGRDLNDPESIERGIGPECFNKATGSHHQVRQPSDQQLEIA